MAFVDAAVAAAANGAAGPSDPRQDTERAEQLRSFDAVMALPDDDRLLARLLVRKMQQRVDGFGRFLRTAGPVEHGTDVITLLGDPTRLKAALAWETAQYDLMCRNRALVPRGKRKRQGKPLRESQLAKLPPGRHSDNANSLHLHVTRAGSRRWVARLTLGFLPSKIRARKRPDGAEEKVFVPKRVDFSLGTWPAVSLAQARERALKCCRLVADGKDPRVVDAASRRTLRDVWEEVLPKRVKAQKWKGGLRGASATKYKNAFDNHVNPVLGSFPIAVITSEQLEEFFEDLDDRGLAGIPPQAKKVLDFCFDHAVLRRWRPDNPVATAIRSVGALGGYKGGIRWVPLHEAYEAYQQICEYGQSSTSPLTVENVSALRSLVLTGKRPMDILDMRWEDMDLQHGLWRIPWARLKNARSMVAHPEYEWALESEARSRLESAEADPLAVPPLADWGSLRHDVANLPFEHETFYYQPLCPEMVEILRDAWRRGSRHGWVFRREMKGRLCPLSESGMGHIMNKLGLDASPHGWRKTARTYIGHLGEKKPDFDVAEMVLAHKVGTSISVLYDKEGFVPERIPVHDGWQLFLHTPPPPQEVSVVTDTATHVPTHVPTLTG